MSDIELLEAILARLLEGGAASVTEVAEDEGTMLLIDAPDDQKGRIIGKRGRTIQALRAIFGAIGAKEGRLMKVDLRAGPEDLGPEEGGADEAPEESAAGEAEEAPADDEPADDEPAEERDEEVGEDV